MCVQCCWVCGDVTVNHASFMCCSLVSLLSVLSLLSLLWVLSLLSLVWLVMQPTWDLWKLSGAVQTCNHMASFYSSIVQHWLVRGLFFIHGLSITCLSVASFVFIDCLSLACPWPLLKFINFIHQFWKNVKEAFNRSEKLMKKLIKS